MKRHAALKSLSRDHHGALALALRLRRATPETAESARDELVAFWRGDGREHFRQEEEMLLPGFAAAGDPYHPLVARVLCDHVAIRHAVDDIIGRAVPDVTALQDLGRRLASHVRLEERELFPLIEETLPATALAALAAELGATAAEHPRG
jgi:hemerythrin-like domain-containing protein